MRRQVLAAFLFAGSWWLGWDLLNSVAWRSTSVGWRFCSPFYIICVGPTYWQIVFDSAFALSLIAFLGGLRQK
jgi:hypothetical protein